MTAKEPQISDQNASLTLDPASLLAWQVAVGADEAIGEEPVDRFVAAQQPLQVQSRQNISHETALPKGQSVSTDRSTGGPRPVAARPVQSVSGASAELAEKIAAAATSLEHLKAAMNDFDGGLLKRSSKNLVFSAGTVGAPIMVIGEAPGAEDDQQGTAFVGRSGRLLDKMLQAAGFDRADNIYLTTLLPWRPLGSRKPDATAIEMCLPFMRRHIELAQPKMVILLGGVSAKALLESSEGITRLRGRWSELKLGEQNIPCMPLYSPDYLINQPHLKGLAWRDLLAVKQKYLEMTS